MALTLFGLKGGQRKPGEYAQTADYKVQDGPEGLESDERRLIAAENNPEVRLVKEMRSMF